MRKLLLVLVLVVQPALAQSLSLRQGWNAVAFQGPTVTQFTGAGAAGAAWWDGSQYVLINANPDAFNAAGGGRRGYWVFATQDTTVTAAATSDSIGNRVDLVPGYNLVSFATATDFPASQLAASVNGQTVPLGQIVLTTFTQINPDNTYTSVDAGSGTIRAGRAYWIFSNANARLTWGATTAGQWSGTVVLTQTAQRTVGPTSRLTTALTLNLKIAQGPGSAMIVNGTYSAAANGTSQFSGVATSAAGALNGNTSGNQTLVSGTLSATGGTLNVTATLPGTQSGSEVPLGVAASFILNREANNSLTIRLPALQTPANSTSTDLSPTNLPFGP